MTWLLPRWRSSLWKLIWKELLVYTLAFLAISLLYRHGLNQEQQATMEQLILWCRKQSTGLPLTFLLGFYVSLVVRRWWEQYCKLPWPDDIALSLSGVVTAGDNNKVTPSRSKHWSLNNFLSGQTRQENSGQVLSPLLHPLSAESLHQTQQALPHPSVHRDVRWIRAVPLTETLDRRSWWR